MKSSNNAAPVAPPVVHLQRVISAAPHKVFRAWLDTELLLRWMAPGALHVQRAEVDERVGGSYRIWHANATSDVGGFDCELKEMVPDSRLVFRWGFVGPERNAGPHFDSLLTVTFSEVADGKTLLILVHEKLDALFTAMPDVANNVGMGWELALDKLSTAVR
ncbi:MAG: SRPBCC domain-containing protein [Gemmatimonadaceae bacterium]